MEVIIGSDNWSVNEYKLFIEYYFLCTNHLLRKHYHNEKCFEYKCENYSMNKMHKIF